MMAAAGRNYAILAIVIFMSALIFLVGRPSETLYGAASLLIMAAFVFVSYSTQRDAESDVVKTHFHRQRSILMFFIVAGIISAVHSIARYHVQSEWISTFAGIGAWLIYAYGIGHLVFGCIEWLRVSRLNRRTIQDDGAPGGQQPAR
jgi:hypothetical protein